MRFFKDFIQMQSEVVRDLAELSVRVHTMTYQDKYIGDDESMATREAQDMIYRVTSPDLADLDPSQPWADAEFDERTQAYREGGKGLNPGEAWKLRPEVWTEFLESDGRFSYTYSERLAETLEMVIEELRQRNMSRQLFIPIWQPEDAYKLADRRVPCSLGYWLNYRQEQLNITYLQRSSDFFTHFTNDVYLARKLQEFIAAEVGLEPGHFTHWLGSIHVFEKDVAHVF